MSDNTSQPSSGAKSVKQIEVTVDPKNLQFAINGQGIQVDHVHQTQMAHTLLVSKISVEKDKKTGEFRIKLTE